MLKLPSKQRTRQLFFKLNLSKPKLDLLVSKRKPKMRKPKTHRASLHPRRRKLNLLLWMLKKRKKSQKKFQQKVGQKPPPESETF
jgi:hypothetical protein